MEVVVFGPEDLYEPILGNPSSIKELYRHIQMKCSDLLDSTVEVSGWTPVGPEFLARFVGQELPFSLTGQYQLSNLLHLMLFVQLPQIFISRA